MGAFNRVLVLPSMHVGGTAEAEILPRAFQILAVSFCFLDVLQMFEIPPKWR